MVVLFGWLLAKSRHLHKYGELYHQYGADVITVKLEVMEILRPKKGRISSHQSTKRADLRREQRQARVSPRVFSRGLPLQPCTQFNGKLRNVLAREAANFRAGF